MRREGKEEDRRIGTLTLEQTQNSKPLIPSHGSQNSPLISRTKCFSKGYNGNKGGKEKNETRKGNGGDRR